jgi:methylenetetrahydrofolate dehydrogenase (NADP+) / methenyltetrahydrofolate cyclohydrolase
MCSVQTQNLRESFQYADIIISATGSAHLIHGDLLPSNRALVIVDAGVNYDPPFVYGDVHMESVRNKCLLITPPKGAIGKVTVAMLAQNLSRAFVMQNRPIKNEMMEDR